MEFPALSLAIDNCFASKRWTRPAEWMELARRLGLSCVEASADTEADPLYTGPEYMEDWVEDVLRCEERSGVRVVNLYSGHGTYTTLGLAHTDARVRQRMRELWLKPMIRAAAKLHAGLGFFCHAFPEAVLQDPGLYSQQLALLEDQLSEAACYGAELGLDVVAVEQMYTPHQVPWTIEGARGLIGEVKAKGGFPLYLTIDTGHQVGQHKFIRPEPAHISKMAREGEGTADGRGIWLGSRRAFDRFEECVRNGGAVSDEDIAFITADMDCHPYLFSASQDGDCYAWLESLGCYSPIIHLQQVTGGVSAHLPFTAQMNSKGIIHPEKVLRSLLQSYLRPISNHLPPRSLQIYLTLEIFAGTSETQGEILKNLRESVDYWRRFIPKDGMRLDELVAEDY
jgi:hypothetical protein